MVGTGADFIDAPVAKKYEMLMRIGRGLYGVVWKANAQEETAQKQVAIKRMFNAFSNKIDAKRTYREIMYLLNFTGHQNIVMLYDVLAGDTDMDMYLVTECMDTDLSSIIQMGLQKIHIKYITWQLLRALKYIHSAGVVHRDIKPPNILINSNCEIRICDFGMARSVIPRKVDPYGPMPAEARKKISHFGTHSILTNYCSSRWYRSPEQLVNAKNYSTSIDIWATGCIVAEIIQKKPLFPGTCPLSQLSHIVHITGRPADIDLNGIYSKYVISVLEGLGKSTQGSLADLVPAATPEARDLIRLCLQFSPDKRLTAAEALEHPFVGHFHDPDAETNHAASFTGGLILPLSDDVQYSTSAYRDRIYADVLKRPTSIDRVSTERRIKLQTLNLGLPDDFPVDNKLAEDKLVYRT